MKLPSYVAMIPLSSDARAKLGGLQGTIHTM